MPWIRKLSTPISLKDARVLTTLADARQFVLDLPAPQSRNARWRYAAQLLLDASRKQSALANAEAQLKIALDAEGWLGPKKSPADLPAGPERARPAGALQSLV